MGVNYDLANHKPSDEVKNMKEAASKNFSSSNQGSPSAKNQTLFYKEAKVPNTASLLQRWELESKDSE